MPASERVNIILAALHTGLRLRLGHQKAFAYSLRAPSVSLPLPAYDGSPNMIAASRFFSENGGEGGKHFLGHIRHLADLHEAQFNRSLTPDEEKAYLEYYELLFRSLLVAKGATPPDQAPISPQDTLDLLRVRQWAIADTSPESPLELIGPDLVELGLNLFSGIPGRLHPESTVAQVLRAWFTGLDHLPEQTWTELPVEDLLACASNLFLETGTWVLEKLQQEPEALRHPFLVEDLIRAFLNATLPNFHKQPAKEEILLQYGKVWKAVLNKLPNWIQHWPTHRLEDQSGREMLLQVLFTQSSNRPEPAHPAPPLMPYLLNVGQIEWLLDRFLHHFAFDPDLAEKSGRIYWKQWEDLWETLQNHNLAQPFIFEQLAQDITDSSIQIRNDAHPMIPVLNSWLSIWQGGPQAQNAGNAEQLKTFLHSLDQNPLRQLLHKEEETASPFLIPFMDHLVITLGALESTLGESPETFLATLISTAKLWIRLPELDLPVGEGSAEEGPASPWQLMLEELIPLQETLYWVQSSQAADPPTGLPGDDALQLLFRESTIPAGIQALKFLGSEVMDLAGEPDLEAEEFADWIQMIRKLQQDYPLLSAESGAFFRFGNNLRRSLGGQDQNGQRLLYREVLKRILPRLDYFWEADPALPGSQNQICVALDQIQAALRADELQPTWSHQLSEHQYRTLLLSTLDRILDNPCWIQDRKLQKALTAMLIAVPFERPPDRVPFEILQLTIEQVLTHLRQPQAWLKKISIEENTQHYPLSYALEWLFQSILSKNTGCRARLLAPAHFSVLLRFILKRNQKLGLSLKNVDDTALQLNEHLNQFANGKTDLEDMLDALRI